MNIQTPEQIADFICNATPSDWAVAEWTMSPADVRASIIAAIEADRAQRVIPAGTPVYIIQSEEGDVIDVTTSREWAEWQTRDDEDVPERALIEETLWDGPIDREDWT